MGDELVVVTDHASRSFRSGSGSIHAVIDATVSLTSQSRVALVGSSGSGKSTLLHLLAGLDAPTSGIVEWPMVSPTRRIRPHLVGVVFQGPSLISPLDALENVALTLQLAGVSDREARERARAALDRLGVGAVASKFPDELSGGQMQRVAIARALAGEPRLLLADEPTGQLDHVSGATVIDALIEAADHLEAGLVVSTHDPAIAGRLPVRWTMSDGRLRIEAPVTC